jgi:hypothetical protein
VTELNFPLNGTMAAARTTHKPITNHGTHTRVARHASGNLQPTVLNPHWPAMIYRSPRTGSRLKMSRLGGRFPPVSLAAGEGIDQTAAASQRDGWPTDTGVGGCRGAGSITLPGTEPQNRGDSQPVRHDGGRGLGGKGTYRRGL